MRAEMSRQRTLKKMKKGMWGWRGLGPKDRGEKKGRWKQRDKRVGQKKREK